MSGADDSRLPRPRAGSYPPKADSGRAVLIGPSSFGENDPTPIRRLEEAGYRVINNPFGRKLTEPELLALLAPDVAGIIAGLEPITRRVLETGRVKAVSRCGAGLGNVDQTAARDLGVVVSSTPDAPTRAVAELTLGCMVMTLRRVPQMDRELHDGLWSKRLGSDLSEKTVLLIGFGRIGKEVARLLRPFGVRLLVADPALTDAPAGGELMSLDDALPLADVISLHASGASEILTADRIGRVRRGAYLFNSARGTLVNEAALIAALEEGIIAGGWFDAFWEEPYRGPLARYPQMLLTPHIATYSAECRLLMETQAAENLITALTPGR